MLKCALTFIFQIMLVWLIRDEKGGNVYTGNVLQNLGRFICAILLHISIMPEIFCAINLLKFVRHNSNGFYGKQSIFPFLCGFMKLIAGLLTEFTCDMIIVQSGNIEAVIKDFIAFGFICSIDDLIMKTVNMVDCEDEIKRAGVKYP